VEYVLYAQRRSLAWSLCGSPLKACSTWGGGNLTRLSGSLCTLPSVKSQSAV